MTRCASRWKRLSPLALLLILAALPARAQDQVDPAFQALKSSNVYVGPNLPKINEAQLQVAAQQASDNPHTVVKIVVLRQLPSLYTDRDTYAHILGQSLNIGKNALIVVVGKKPDAGVSIFTEATLSKSDRAQLFRETKDEIFGNGTTTYGIADLAKKTAARINANEYSGGGAVVLWIIFGVVVLGVGGLVWSGARRRKQELAARRVPIDALRQNVLSGIEYLDGYTDVLPKNNPDSDQVRLYRQAASTKFDQAAKIIDRATDISDLNRAQDLLDRAQADVQQARRALDRATGGTGNIPGDDALRVEPLPTDQSQVEQIPQNRRGVSFFSGRPADVGSLVPVTITVNGMERQVLVTPEEADELRAGRMPQVRSFQVGGRYVPWYAYDAYDPYRDYWQYQNSGWGFGNGLVAGFIGAELLDSLTAPAYMPYAYATDNAYYQGYNNAVMNQGAFGFDGNSGGGGWFGGGDNNSGFGGNDGGGFGGGDTSPYADTAGMDYSGDSGDFGGGDFGGGSDFDSGGGDSGGGDSGGGDF